MLITKQIEYVDGATLCIGFLAYDDLYHLPQPCVMIAHDWGGRGESACKKAQHLAKMGYIGFAIDMYGNAQSGETKAEKRALLTPLMEQRPLITQRIIAAFDTACSLSIIDSNKIAAIGYCFGGLCVLDLARAGVDVKGVVSFHGLLSEPPTTPAKPCTAKVLVLHGYDDPLVKPQQLGQFALEMTEKKIDWQIHIYSNTAHSFTNPDANDNEMGLHYNFIADCRSWKTTERFLNELFSKP